MSGDGADLPEYPAALALEALLHPAPVGPADTHAGNAAAPFHLLSRPPGVGEAALAAVCRRVSPAEAERLQRQFGEE